MHVSRCVIVNKITHDSHRWSRFTNEKVCS